MAKQAQHRCQTFHSEPMCASAQYGLGSAPGSTQANALDRCAASLSQTVSRKTVLNVLGDLSSMLRTAKSWGYCTQAITINELDLPSETLRKQTLFFNGEEARKIIMLAPEPHRTMFAIAAMTGMRVGEVVGLQSTDLDFDHRVINVQRSAWYGRVPAHLG